MGARAEAAGRAALAGLVAGAFVGFLDALRCRLEPGSVLPAAASPVVVLLYAGVVGAAAAVPGLLLRAETAAAVAVAGAAALGLGLAANHYWLPAFTDPISLAGDGAVLAVATGLGWILRRRLLARGLPGIRRCLAIAGGALAASLLLAIGGGREDAPAPTARRTGEGAAPDVLLVVVDTLRADEVGFSGSPTAPPTPVMDGLAREGTVFTACRATSSWTKPSTASLLTGLHPSEHGALDFESVVPGRAATLAEILRAAGWRTAAFADNPFVSPEYGFAQGFDAFEGRHPSPIARGTLLGKALGQVRLRVAGGAAYSFGPGVDLGADRVLGDAVAFLARDPRPGFAYCHLIEPHYPYAPPPPFDGGRPRVDPPHSSGILPFDSFPDLPAAAAATMRENYRGEVRAADAALGRAVEALRRAGRWERTLVVLTSDHGEEFHEHGGWTHGQSLYEELVRVPLVVRVPGGRGAGRRCDEAVSGVDVLPTILELAGVAAPGGAGRSLVPAVDGKGLPSRPSFAELESGPVGARAVFLGRHALVHAWKSGRTDVRQFDLASDPGEARALAASPELERLLEERVAAMRAGTLGGERRRMDEETRRALEALGYGGR